MLTLLVKVYRGDEVWGDMDEIYVGEAILSNPVQVLMSALGHQGIASC